MTYLSTEFAPRPDLDYPFKRGWNPQPGEPFELADGVFWLRMPLPISLDHINLWVLRDGDGWVIVDSGYDHPSCQEVWDKVFENFLTPASVKRIVITHFHPDHIGLASWLAIRCDCKIFISQGEFTHYRDLLTRDKQQQAIDINQFIGELGFAAEFEEIYHNFFTIDPKSAESRVQAEQCEFIAEHDELLIGDHRWRIVMGNGHSPEHACLYCEELGLLISGDQALPRISSNISVYLSNRHEDPLGNWLDSCAKLRDQLPHTTLVLPSHQEPFVGLNLRMQQLIDDHHAQLNRIRITVSQPTNASELMKVLFPRELGPGDTLMATGETMSHINYLLHRGEINKTESDGPVIDYLSATTK